MNNMLLRALTGTVYVALVVCCTLLGINWFWILITAFAVLAIYELQTLMSHKCHQYFPARIWDLFVCVAILFSVRCMEIGAMPLPNNYLEFAIFFGLLGITVFVVYMPVRMIMAVCDRSENPLRSTFGSLLTLIYLALPLSFLLFAYVIGGKVVVMATFIYIWVNDTGAYLTGITVGKHRLCERLSPKKSWEGFWGGFLFSVAAGVLTPIIIGVHDAHAYVMWGIYGAAVSVFSTYGDLFESLIKRTIGVKDSGKIIPGHGGILDRIDSLLAVAPIALIFAVLIDGLMF